MRCWLALGLWLAATSASAAELRVTVRDARGQPLPEAVVMLESPQAARAVKPLIGVELVQRDKTFIPRVLVVTRGTAVSFPNEDTVRHHVYSLSPAKPFEIKLYAGTPANPVVFDRAGVVVLGCNIHDEMVAWIVVADTPYHGLTDPKGTTRLAAVPAGAYSLVVWHPDLPVGSNGVRRAVTLRDGAPVVVDVVVAEVGR